MTNLPKKSVLFVMTSSGYGGLEMNTLKLIQLLANRGWKVCVAFMDNTRFAEEVAQLKVEGIGFEKVKKYFDFKAAKQLAAYIKEQEIEVVFSTYRPDLDLIAWAKRKTKFVHIHQQHMQIGIPKKGVIQKIRYKAIDSWISPLQWLKEEVIEKTIIKEDQIEVVPIGVDTSRFTSLDSTKEDAQLHFNCQTSNRLIGVLGRIDEKKGQLFLIKAIESLRAKGEKVSLLIVGEPTINDPKGKEYYDTILHYIKTNQLEDVIHFAPFTNKIELFYKAIDVFVMSSEGETYGMVTLEALLSEVPVIGTNSGGTPEILSYAENSMLYEFNDLQSFESAYQNIAFDNDKNTTTKNTIEKNFAINKEVDGIERLLCE